MKTSVATAALLATFAGMASAQIDPSLVTGLSSGCASGLLSLVTTSGVSSCLSLGSAIGALTGGGSNSLIPSLDGYFKQDICGKDPCQASALQNASMALGSACQSDLSGDNTIPAFILYFLQNYDLLRETVCLTNTKDNQLCIIDTMYALQNATSMPITFSSLQGLLSNETIQQGAIQAISQNKTAYCTDCNDALLTTLSMGAKSSNETASAGSTTNSALSGLSQSLGKECGANFTDNVIPSSVKNGTTGGTSTAPSSGSSGSNSGSNGAASMANAGAFGVAAGLFAAGLAFVV